MEKYQLLTLQLKKGTIINKRDYLSICSFIIDQLENNTDRKITIIDLLNAAKSFSFEQSLKENFAWYLLQVKQDLEARKILLSTLNKNKIPELKINSKVLKVQKVASTHLAVLNVIQQTGSTNY